MDSLIYQLPPPSSSSQAIRQDDFTHYVRVEFGGEGQSACEDAFIHTGIQCLQMVRRNHQDKVLLDMSRLSRITSNIQVWLQETFLPEIVRYGARQVTILLPTQQKVRDRITAILGQPLYPELTVTLC